MDDRDDYPVFSSHSDIGCGRCRGKCRLHLFAGRGTGICNRTGNLSDRIQAVWTKWNFNHTSLWIDQVFDTAYAEIKRGFRATVVAAEDGLTAAEISQLG